MALRQEIVLNASNSSDAPPLAANFSQAQHGGNRGKQAGKGRGPNQPASDNRQNKRPNNGRGGGNPQGDRRQDRQGDRRDDRRQGDRRQAWDRQRRDHNGRSGKGVQKHRKFDKKKKRSWYDRARLNAIDADVDLDSLSDSPPDPPPLTLNDDTPPAGAPAQLHAVASHPPPMMIPGVGPAMHSYAMPMAPYGYHAYAPHGSGR